jgi:DNA-binding NarL/FixJ family response regulator
LAIEDKLTKREMQIAALIAEGYEYREIGRMLGRSPQTVKNQTGSIYSKLGLKDPKRRPSILLTRMVVREQMEDESP